ncbi:hypothetical protein NDU88_001590 [Pleurodeles waltl]|uniref:Basic proline-rich protein-like n=1 Tax=Pleurodeles waltl TaxID=8319 RepID=A0AAV7R910_PLEWA|nr:hypothetical protein NDU88_001590 [Pleurodeles waltl]
MPGYSFPCSAGPQARSRSRRGQTPVLHSFNDPQGPQPSGPSAVPTGPRVISLSPLAWPPVPHQLRDHVLCTVFDHLSGAPAARSPAGPITAPGRAHLGASSRLQFHRVLPPGGSRFSPGFSAVPGPGGGPVPLTSLLAGASHWVPAVRSNQVPDLWGLAPPGPPDLRRASPIPRGSGAAHCCSRLLPVLTPGLRCHTFKETLLVLPLCLRPSACARQRPPASRDAPTPAEGEGRLGSPWFSPGLSAPPGLGGNLVPLTALHAGASHRVPAVLPGPVPDLWGPRSPPGFSNPWGTGCSPAPLAPLLGADPRAPMLPFQGDPLGSSPPHSAFRPHSAAAHSLTRGPGSSRGGGRRSPSESPARLAPPLTPGLKRGPGRLQDRPPVRRPHSGSVFPGDGTLFLWINVSPSGARGLSVRHLRIAGHAPLYHRL